jgi:pimeloyl-ACP methyl ester carboxylesterase
MRPALFALALLLAPVTASAQEVWETIPAPPPMPEPVQSGMAPVNGIEMYYAIFGPEGGTPVLLIHGGLGHADIWASQVADLMADHRVIVADTRGHGRSTNDQSAYSYDLLAADYVALMEYLGTGPVDLVGWSDGANIGYTISLGDPAKLASHFAHAGNVTLAGIDPSVETDPVFGAYIGMMAEDYARLSPTPDGFDGFLAGVAAMWGTEKPGGVAALDGIAVPTLVVQSEHDEAILGAHSALIAEKIPNARLLVLPGVSHFAMLQDPGTYTAAIRAFID